MFRNLLVGFAVVMLAVLPGQGWAKGPPDGPSTGINYPGKWWRVPDLTEQLNLSAEEKTKLDALYLEHHSRLIDARAARNKAKLILDDLLEKDELDEKAVFAQLETANEALSRINTERFRFLVEVRKLLGVERYAQLKGLFFKHRMERRIRDSKEPPEEPAED